MTNLKPQVGDLILSDGLVYLVGSSKRYGYRECEACGEHAPFMLTAPDPEMYRAFYCDECLNDSVNSFDAVDSLYRPVHNRLSDKEALLAQYPNAEVTTYSDGGQQITITLSEGKERNRR